VWKAGVRELEYSLDGRLGGGTVTVARAGFRGRHRSFGYGREERVTANPAIRLFIFFNCPTDFKYLEAEGSEFLARPVVATLDRLSLDLPSEHDNDVYILFPY
jgi:hypothetical protein